MSELEEILMNNSGEQIYEESCRLLSRKWPSVWAEVEMAPAVSSVRLEADTPQVSLIVNDLHLSSSYDHMREAELQASLVPDDSPIAWVYGVGTGDVIRVLLMRESVRVVNVVPLSFAVLAVTLKCYDHRDWLSDSRVIIHHPSDLKDLQRPFCTIPPEMILAEEVAAVIRDVAHLELSSSYLENEGKFARLRREHSNIRSNISTIAVDDDVGSVFGSRQGQRVIVASGGPSLSQNIEILRDMAGGCAVVAVDAVLRTLLNSGVTPDFVVTLDSDSVGVLRYFEVDPGLLLESSLIYFPESVPEVVGTWPGKRYVAYSKEYRDEELAREALRERLYCSGSVFHAAVDLSVRLGASEVVLFGADFGYPGRMCCEGGSWVVNGLGQRIPSQPNLIGYLRDFEDYVRTIPGVRVVNASLMGARITGVDDLHPCKGGEDVHAHTVP